MNNVAGLDNFSSLTKDEMMMVEGGAINVGNLVKAIGAVYAAGYAVGSFVGNLLK
ncbi:hypothetical protein Hs30E_11000 [Lactococcus hodotermopsidis]|uniref:Bacteriocin n=1 Tax=Pseudolactococcus hodotermopsidis TaxID=2709157 RepID=A0A6A0BAV4_9LACT|nr:class IIb bacteriocin, lactobin A/cerein 7B family [Lactococcus hodotermopsidis]GFH42549.1 hypothetical protein Hs30E_11000 [Lactococcus hodotermopsidis]